MRLEFETKVEKVKVTENQLKVIKDKYLRDDPSVENWLMGVAENIALSELLYDKNVDLREVLKDVNAILEEHDIYGKRARAILIHKDLISYNGRAENFKKFINNLYDIAQNNLKIREKFLTTRDKFYDLMASWEFLPNSPTLMNAGRDLQQLSGCFVLPIEDSIEGWMKTAFDTAMVHKSGGGTGFSVSRVRPRGDRVMSTSGVASGPLSPLKIIDEVTAQIKQGGTRRGANMGILSVYHPDIMDFINVKKKQGELENFNISVSIDSNFMKAVKEDNEIELINPKNKTVAKKIKAKTIWNEIIKGAWETGDPGYVVIDRINNSESNPTPSQGAIESTNPCITGDTLVSTEKGLVRMEDLVKSYPNGGIRIATDSRVPIRVKSGKGIVLMNQATKGITFNEISQAFCSGVKDVYSLETKNGCELKLTEDHKLITRDGFVKVKDLKENDEILLQLGEGAFGNDEVDFNFNKEFIGKNGKKYANNFLCEWSRELGQVIGWLVGDGWLRSGGKNYRVGFTFGNSDLKVMEYLKPIINNFYGKQINEIKRANGVYHLSYHSKYFVEFFERLGVKNGKAQEKVVPESIFTASKEAVIGFLQGLFTSDGTVRDNPKSSSQWIALTSKSKELLKGVQILLFNLGVKSTIFNRSRKPRNNLFQYTNKNCEVKTYGSDGILYELGIFAESLERFRDNINFISSSKKLKLDNIKIKKTREQKFYEIIKNIRYIGKEKVYDLTEPFTHSMICNSIVTTQCGEQPLLSYEPCNLGSINLSKFVKKDLSGIDYERLKECIFNSVHFLDNVIDINNYPLPEIEYMAKKNRRIGLGVMGWAEVLAMLKISYNSDDAFNLAEEVMEFVNYNALKASEQLAEERGVFPGYKDCIYDRKGRFFKGFEAWPRNSARTTIAPTGTIAITAGLQGSGIEPFFAIVYVRYNAHAIDALKEGKTPDEKDTFYEINPIFKKVAQDNDYFGLNPKELWKKIDNNHKSVLGLKEIPEEIQKIFLTAHDLKPLDHVKMQCSFQKYTNNAVSKTVNLRNEATIEDVEEVYKLAYEYGAKGVTIYRDGSKNLQILNLTEKKTEKKEIKERRGELSNYYEISTGQGPLHIHVNYDEIGPTRIFANLSPTGTEISGMTTALAILLSKYFGLGGDPVRILKHLNSIKGDRPFGFGKNRVDSIPHALAKVLRDHLVKTGKVKDYSGQTSLEGWGNVEKKTDGVEISLHCPKCFSTNVAIVSGCEEPTCFDCGYSKCS